MKFIVSSLLAVSLIAVNAPVAHAQSDILASATRLASTVELEQEPGSVVRRMRSTTLTLLGVGALALGAALAMAPPHCDRTGEGVPGTGSSDGGYFLQYKYSAEFRKGRCDIAVDVSVNPAARNLVYFGIADRTFPQGREAGDPITAVKSYVSGYGTREDSAGDGFFTFGTGGVREYYHDITDNQGNGNKGFIAHSGLFPDGMMPTRSNARRGWGVAAAVGGAVALISGLWRVERELRESVDVPFRVGVTPDGGVLATRSIRW